MCFDTNFNCLVSFTLTHSFECLLFETLLAHVIAKVPAVWYGPSGQREAGTNCSQIERKNTGAHKKDAFTSKNVRRIRMTQSKK